MHPILLCPRFLPMASSTPFYFGNSSNGGVSQPFEQQSQWQFENTSTGTNTRQQLQGGSGPFSDYVSHIQDSWISLHIHTWIKTRAQAYQRSLLLPPNECLNETHSICVFNGPLMNRKPRMTSFSWRSAGFKQG